MLDTLTGRDVSRIWVGCFAAPLEEDGQRLGVLVLLTDVQETVDSLISVRDRMVFIFLLALAVVLALALPALAAVSADTVPYNTGTRHELCTALSAQAEQYYTDGAETLLKLSGSTSDSSLESMDSALYRALQSLMTDTMTDSVTYKSLPTYWARTDASQGKDGLLLFYSDTTGGSMSREHVWPKSRASFMQQNGGSDLHHLRPEDSGVNSTRSNYTMGNVLGVYPDCSTKAFDGKTVL